MSFWRDVLGFEVRDTGDGDGPVELVSGAARIRLGANKWAPDVSGEAKPPGSAIVFFVTDDVEGMHAAVKRRGHAAEPRPRSRATVVERPVEKSKY